jgi:hypothetical protein
MLRIAPYIVIKFRIYRISKNVIKYYNFSFNKTAVTDTIYGKAVIFFTRI